MTDELSNKFLRRYKTRTPEFGFNGLGYITYKRCVDWETPVLCADFIWRRAGDLEVGDKIFAFDDKPVKKNKYAKRYYRYGTVLYNNIEKAKVMGIELEDGTILYATPDHRWLAKFDGNSRVDWRETKDLCKTKKGNSVFLLRPFGKPWKVDTSYESGYISAGYDGEGNLDRVHSTNFTQIDNPMLKRMELYLKKIGINFVKKSKSNNTTYEYKKNRQKCYTLRTHTFKDVIRLLGITQPRYMLEKFRKQFEKYSENGTGKEMRCSPEDYVKVVRIFDAGERDVAVLSTDVETHFTGGFASHNTYARTKEDGTKEEWWETVKRCVEGAQAIGADYTQEEMERLYDYVFNLKGNFAGRMLWQLGTETVKKYGGASMNNCWYVSMRSYEDFCFVFDNLMLGGGVGFSVRREDIHELPRINKNVVVKNINTKDADFIVPDSREGWVELLRRVLDVYFNGGKSFSYSTILIRGKGEPIKGFGGTASGPGILVEGIGKICNLLDEKAGKKLKSTDVLDIVNILGSIVVAGNVRRSAEIAIGESDDVAYIKAKRWDLGNIPNWRAMSNNSVDISKFDDDVLPQIWAGYKGNGEPYGFVNMRNSQRYGRLKDGLMKDCDMYPTQSDNCEGFNPCAEITLADGEPCNLCELNLNRLDSVDEAKELAVLLYKVQKAITSLPFQWEKSQNIVRKNRRLGLGVTGVCQSSDKIEWLDEVYKELRAIDNVWSEKQKVPRSIKLTTVKPSGTLSLLAGATPGVHPAYSQYYIRRIRLASDDELVQSCKDAGLHIEYVENFDKTKDLSTVVVEFPCTAGEGAILAKDMTAIDQLELVKKLQTEWADNAVSVTVYYKMEELEGIQEWLKENYHKSVKSVSFLLHNEHGFAQAPYEEIDQDKYEKMMEKVDLSKLIIKSDEMVEGLGCESGVCPVR